MKKADLRICKSMCLTRIRNGVKHKAIQPRSYIGLMFSINERLR